MDATQLAWCATNAQLVWGLDNDRVHSWAQWCDAEKTSRMNQFAFFNFKIGRCHDEHSYRSDELLARHQKIDSCSRELEKLRDVRVERMVASLMHSS